MEATLDVVLEHIALSANKSCNCLDVNRDNVISFGCSNSVVLYKPLGWDDESHQLVVTFNHHSGKVLCTKWIKKIENGSVCSMDCLLSGSSDKTVAVWNYSKNSEKSSQNVQLSIISILKGHSDSVTSMDVMFISELEMYVIVTTAADSTVKIWLGKDLTAISCIQTIDLKNAFVFDVVLHYLPHSKTPILACASDDFTIKVYVLRTLSENDYQFEKVLDLKGHEDWVRSVDFIDADEKTLYLASSSQDSFIRLWKITQGKDKDNDELKLKKQNFSILVDHDVAHYNVAIDAVLSGHENWVYSVHWHRKANGDLMLLSSSIDKTVVVWTYDNDTAMWVDSVRVGEVGGNTLGFYGAQFSSDGDHIIAHSYSGALHGWDKHKNSWKAGVILGGHMSTVSDIAWEPKFGRYLISVSEDQTARLFSSWKKNSTWHEMARPQIHGYDMQCIALIDSVKYVSGADEKVLRVFDASKNFIHNFESLTSHTIQDLSEQAPEGATVPALGLSNKPVLIKQEPVISNRSEQYIENLFSPVELDQPPPESYLLQNTLWPESRKIYGHVYEIFCVACNYSGTLVASAAKSSQPKHSGIMIWNVSSWKQVCILLGHTLTVTQMEFSPNDKYLLSVSRDRSWILHEVVNSDTVNFEKVAQSEKKTGHSRIIWSCSWSFDSRYFATASRDKKVAVWQVSRQEDSLVKNTTIVDCKEPVTAVAFMTSSLTPNTYHFAVGLESGTVKILKMMPDLSIVVLLQLNTIMSHCLTVKRLKWRPFEDENKENSKTKWLASCGRDHQVKIFKLTFSSKTM